MKSKALNCKRHRQCESISTRQYESFGEIVNARKKRSECARLCELYFIDEFIFLKSSANESSWMCETGSPPKKEFVPSKSFFFKIV